MRQLSEPMASYSASTDGARVISVVGDTVTVKHGALTVEYRGVKGRYVTGDAVTEPVQHHTRIERRTWSVFDGESDDD